MSMLSVDGLILRRGAYLRRIPKSWSMYHKIKFVERWIDERAKAMCARLPMVIERKT